MSRFSRFELVSTSIIKIISALKNSNNTQINSNEEEIKKILFYERKTLQWRKSIRRLNIIIISMYVALYFSFASLFVNNIILVSEIISLLTIIVSITGTTIFIFILSLSQYAREIHHQRLQLIHSHLIQMCTKHKIEPPFILEYNDNEYKEMINLLDTLDLEMKREQKMKRTKYMKNKK